MNKSIKIIINYFLAPVLFVVLCWSLYQQIIHQPDLSAQWKHIQQSWSNPLCWLVGVLMMVNWGIETQKWVVLMRPAEKLTFYNAFKSVLAGCSITMLTPNRIGEYGGRILYVKPENRLKGISLTILGSLSQLIVTLVAGVAGLIAMKYFSPHPQPVFEHVPAFMENILLGTSIAVLVVLLLLYLNVHWFVVWMGRIKPMRRLMNHISVLDQFSGKQLLRIILLSFFRYLVFILQYIVMLKVMQVDVGWVWSAWILSVFFLVMAMAPTIGFLELPIRATATVELFGMYSSNVAGIQAAAFGIWIINLAVPALIGSLFVFGLKLIKEK